MNLVLMGIQGSGKGTQAKLLSQKLNLTHINVGDLFRTNIKQQTEFGKTVMQFINKGELVPDNYVFQLIETELKGKLNNFILDGFPRTTDQGDYLVNNAKIDKVILFDLSDEIATERMLARRNCKNCHKDYNLLANAPKVEDVCDACGGELVKRSDDTLEAIKTRLDAFHQETQPVIDFFTEKGLMLTIDANQPIETIHNQVLQNL